MPRIISGLAGSVPLQTPKGQLTRPTSDKTKEALFSIISSRMPARGFLDLFSGSGQMGLEAASRGCSPVVLIEKSNDCVNIIRKNSEKTRLAERVTLLPGDVRKWIRKLLSDEQVFEIIFIDPPYDQALAVFEEMASDLAGLLRSDGLLILEHNAADESPPIVMNLKRSRRCQYGTAMLSFYQLNSTD